MYQFISGSTKYVEEKLNELNKGYTVDVIKCHFGNGAVWMLVYIKGWDVSHGV